ncbi:MAG: hypothetical protein ACOWWM_05315 [Desulfobacterales bacterium]
MAEIISIDRRREDDRKHKAAGLLRRKQLAVRGLLRCARCASGCEKCGKPTGGGCRPPFEDDPSGVRIPYRFCDDCSEEYIDYIERLKGNGDADCYWRNHAWIESWTAWIHYRAAMDSHFKSKEFLRLVQELKPSPFGE